jgi:hypothetical protein
MNKEYLQLKGLNYQKVRKEPTNYYRMQLYHNLDQKHVKDPFKWG